MKTLTKILIGIFLLANFNLIKAETLLDFDGDGKSDFAVTRDRTVGSDILLDWFIERSSDNSMLYAQFGLGGFKPSEFSPSGGFVDVRVPADYDGDNKTDIAVWRDSTAVQQSFFYILNSSDFTVRVEQFGQQGDKVNIIGDYDGDDKADLTVYRAFGAGTHNAFIYRGSLNNPNGNLTYVAWGSGDFGLPYRGDFDGDGKLDFCVRHNSSGLFVLLRSSDSGVEYINWGLGDDFPIPGDYDGDGRTDFCVLRTVGKERHWYILERDGGGTGAVPIVWGADNMSVINVGDYDGDGKTDLCVTTTISMPDSRRVFYVRKSSDETMMVRQWGTGNALPVRTY